MYPTTDAALARAIVDERQAAIRRDALMLHARRRSPRHRFGRRGRPSPVETTS
ncbi:MAG TPA: hypothetical protein VF743_03625 [Acidimicrobiales bacterium]